MSVSHTPPTGANLAANARKAIESAITQATTIKHEPHAVDVRDGTRLDWLLDDLLRARLELSLLAESAPSAPEAENSENRAPHAEPEPIGSTEPQPKTASGPDRRELADAGNYLDQVMRGLAMALEVAGQDSQDEETWELLRESLLSAWSGTRLARLELGLTGEGER